MIVCRKVTKKGDVASRQVYKQRFVDVRECSQMDYKTVTHVGLYGAQNEAFDVEVGRF